MKTCKLCKKPFRGRTDKVFCSVQCKSQYHIRLRQVTTQATKRIDSILHRNRSILLEILGKDGRSLSINRAILDKKKFNYHYVTSYHLNSKNKLVNYVYDFSWIIFSDNNILIQRV